MRKFSQMAAAAMGMAKGTSADRPENPAVGDQFVNGTLGITEVYTENDGWQPLTSASTGIPFGGTADRPEDATGQPFFNGEEARLELFTSGTGWQNIVQETPSVVNVVGRYIEGNPSTTLTINGSNFASGAIASVIGQDGTETIADTTQLVSVAEVTATFSGLSATNEPYDVKVLNPSNLYGIAFDILQVDDIPAFITQSGSLGAYVEGSSMSVQISATDEEESPLSFSVSSGSLPPGLSLNTATGEISGTPTDVIPNTTSTFEISATDGNNTATRNFSITVNDRGPTWQTPQTLAAFTKGVLYTQTLVAIDDNDQVVNYSIHSGSLPVGLTLNAATGEISGTSTSSTEEIFTVRATDTNSGGFSDRQFTIPNTGPQWVTSSSLPRYSKGVSYNEFIEAVDDSESQVSYSLISGNLPSGLQLTSGTGEVSGIPTSIALATFTIRAEDTLGNFSDREFVLGNSEPQWSISNPYEVFTEEYTELALPISDDDRIDSLSITSGTLPSGLSLDSANKKIIGTLTAGLEDIGTIVSITLEATDSSGNTISGTIDLQLARGASTFTSSSTPSSYVEGDVVTFAYKGSQDVFAVQNATRVKLEVWGAGGKGESGKTGGTGGYSSGEYLTTGYSELYCHVGQAGRSPTGTAYGGGGYGNFYNGQPSGGGGGGTDFRTSSGSYGSNLSTRIIVAGGGGGNGIYSNSPGGHGGGLNGSPTNGPATGGTQNGPGNTESGSASFGFGGSYVSNGAGSGGGGGWYGGGSGWDDPGGGGSGYIGGVENGVTTLAGGSNPGVNGQAKVTILSIS